MWNSHASRTTVVAAAVAICALAASPARALDVGYYEMCNEAGSPAQAPPITNAGHTAISLVDLSPAELAGVDVIMVNNCDNFGYGAEYLANLGNIDAAVASGKILILHDRYVDIAETILPGGSAFDVQRHPVFPDPLNEARDIDVLDGSTLITNGPAGVITDTSLDNGNFSNHGFTVAGSLPGTARLVLSTNVPDHIVTFLYTYGSGAVLFSSIPLDHYLGGSTPFATVYAVNVAHYAAYLTTSCGNGETDPGEDCDLAGDNGVAGGCCTAGCGFESAATLCRAATGVCDQAETCSGASGVCPADALEPAGEVCRGAAGECDVAETCDGATDACPADGFESAGVACTDEGDLCTDDECDGAGACGHLDKPDSDVDGTCDEQDVCNNVGGAQTFLSAKPRPNLTFTKVNNDVVPGNDGFRLSGEFALAVGRSFGDLNPIATGARVLVDNVADVSRVEQTLPGGAYAGRGTRGWKVNGAGTTWSYTDSTASPLSGIRKLKITDRSKASARRVKVSMSGVRSTYPVIASDTPLNAVVVLGDQLSAIDGLCGETAFGGSSCKLNGTGTTVTCK